MSAAETKWWHDPAELRVRYEQAGRSWKRLADLYEVPVTTLKHHGHKHNISTDQQAEQPGFQTNGDTAVFVSEAQRGLQPKDIATLLADAGIQTDDWQVERCVVNEYEALMKGADDEPVVVKLRQLKAFLKRAVPLEWVFPAVEVRERKPPQKRSFDPVGTRLIWIAGDQQAPYHDEDLHAATLRWLKDTQPDEGVLIGDTCDFPTVSRHGDNPNWAAPVQECLNAGYRILSDYRDAAPNTLLRKLRGNHDWRLDSELLSRAERMFGIRPADIPGEPEGPHALSLRRLLHLDALHIDLVGVEGDHWKFGEYRIAPRLLARHAPPPKSGARTTADLVYGHDHKQYVKSFTEWTDEGESLTRTEMGVGTMAQLRRGLGYAVDPDWQAGFGTITVFPDGHRLFELATFRNGRLMWRGETW